MNANRKNLATKIKGYLPVRVALPRDRANDHHSFTSFIYIKEHNEKSQQGSGGVSAKLFIANAPANGPIRTDLFLRALFESYGSIQRVTVTQDPRKVASSTTTRENSLETFREAALTGLDFTIESRKGDGKFAHVVFTSGKEMKKAIKRLVKEISDADDVFTMHLDEERIDQLVKETMQLDSDEIRELGNGESQLFASPLTGIHSMAEQARRRACRHISRQNLMQMCNDAMASFESEEEEALRRAKLASEQPDEEGFITVVNKSMPSFGVTNDLEDDHHHRRKAGKRNRKRKAGYGAEELPDFYRFQLKETRKNEVQDLKKRFEEDLAKVRKMKEERAYRPF
jgi:ribosomal RNA-processing protein 7